MHEIIPTIVPTTFEELAAHIERLSTFARTIHIDAADGVFAPNLTWLPREGEHLPHPEIAYEAHLMVSEPLSLGTQFAKAGAKRIIAHLEAFSGGEAIADAFSAWRAAGASEVGLALLLDTSLERIGPYVAQCDVVHLMTIATIGKQGNPFEPRSIQRVAEFHAQHPTTIISVDGGETIDVVDDLARAGATRFSIGSALSLSTEPAAVYKRLLDAAGAVQ